jgi:hypothetical protein
VLFVLGEHAEEPRVEVVLRHEAAPPPARAARTARARRGAARPLPPAPARRLSPPRGCACRARRPGRGDRARGCQLDAAEAQIVEHVFELVRQARHDRVAPKRPESPFSVCTARKTSLMSSASRRPRLQSSSRCEQIAAEAVDELLRLAEELVAGLVPPSPRPPPPSTMATPPAGGPLGPPPRREEPLAGLAQLLGVNGLGR